MLDFRCTFVHQPSSLLRQRTDVLGKLRHLHLDLGQYTVRSRDNRTRLAGPLLACAHAGLSTLALVAITDAGDDPLRMADLVQRAEECAPALEDLVLSMTDELATVARDLEEELS